MNIILLIGPPGAGKGTQADFICAELGIPKISTGDMLRATIKQGAALGQKIKAVMDAGQLVSDDIIVEMLTARIAADDCRNGYLLDGFPRNESQAERLEQLGIQINTVIELQISDAEITRRLTGRRVHLASGRTYHVDFNPPKNPGLDDLSGEPLTQRSDDQPDTVAKRLRVYHAETEPLIDWYKKRQEVFVIDSSLAVDEVKNNILKLFAKKKSTGSSGE